MATITVLPNQSMADVIIMACGSMEAGMQFCADNNVAISDVPVVGAVYVVSDVAVAAGGSVGAGVLVYMQKRGIVVGTLASVAADVYADEAGNVYTDEAGNVYTPE